MKRLILIGMLLGLLTGVALAQRGRAVSPTARPDVDISARRSTGASPTLAPNSTIMNRNVSPTAAPMRDPIVGTSATVAPDGTLNRQRDPLVGVSKTGAPTSTTVNRNVNPTLVPGVRDPK